jgi:hypothetical protein
LISWINADTSPHDRVSWFLHWCNSQLTSFTSLFVRQIYWRPRRNRSFAFIPEQKKKLVWLTIIVTITPNYVLSCLQSRISRACLFATTGKNAAHNRLWALIGCQGMSLIVKFLAMTLLVIPMIAVLQPSRLTFYERSSLIAFDQRCRSSSLQFSIFTNTWHSLGVMTVIMFVF